MEDSPKRRAAAVMAAQHGTISRQQALDCGLTRGAVQRSLHSGQWVPVLRGVYRSAAVAQGYQVSAMAAWLLSPPGAAFSHFTAARFHGLDIRPGSRAAWLSIPHGKERIRPPGVRIVRSRTLAGFTDRRDPWVVTTLARTLADLGGLLPADRLKGAVYQAIQQGKTDEAGLRRAWEVVRSRNGRNTLGEVLHQFEGGFDSGLEVDAARIFRTHGIPLVAQYRVTVAGRIIRRFDFADPHLLIGVEIDGLAYHSSIEAQQRDRAKDRELAVHGWVTVRFTAADIRERPASMVLTLRRLRERRRRVFAT